MDQIRFDNTTAKLVTEDRAVLNAVHDALVFQPPGYQYTEAFKTGRWDGRIKMFSLQNYTFPAGLVRWVRNIAAAKGIDIALADLRDRSKRLPPLSKEVLSRILEGKELRDYQVKAIQRIFGISRGVIQSPTGSGKTVIAAGAAKAALEFGGLRTLFLTHQKELLHQTQEAFIKAGIDCGIVGDGIRKIRPVTVATIQTLYAAMKKVKSPVIRREADGTTTRFSTATEVINMMLTADFVILDEAHRGDAESFQAVTLACKNAYYRIGLSATPLMKGQEADMKLMAVTGDVIYRITIQDLVDRGLLAQPYIKFVKITAPMMKKTPYQKAYKLGVVENEQRNNMIIGEAVDLAVAGETVLVLVAHVNHGKRLLQLLRTRYAGLKVRFIHGSNTGEERDKALTELAEGRLNILISSSITDEGVDIPNISAAILAGGMKSTIKLYQRIGRAMRPKAGLNRALIVDFIDLTNKHLAKHSKERFEAIRDEPGFVIVPDFNTLLRRAA